MTGTNMPTGTLQFTLPDEEAEFRTAQQGREAKVVLWDIDQKLRSLLKHGQASQETRELAEAIREMIPYVLLED
jgi:hypothetical protein